MDFPEFTSSWFVEVILNLRNSWLIEYTPNFAANYLIMV